MVDKKAVFIIERNILMFNLETFRLNENCTL